MSNRKLMSSILDVYVECNIRTFPLNCFAILHHYGFKDFAYSQLEKENRELYLLCYQYSSDAFMYANRRFIAYNDSLNLGRIRFSLMHELGHYILKHKGKSKYNEDEADEFASHFLAPRILIHKYGYRTADQIHDAFGLSYAASNRALVSYREWYRNISHSVSRKPTEPELEIERIFFTETPKDIEREKPKCEQNSWDLRPLKEGSEVMRQMQGIGNLIFPNQLSWHG